MLNETFLKPNHFKLPGYIVYRKDRISHGGGVAIAVKLTLEHKLETSHNTKIFENIYISMDICNSKILFISAYCPGFLTILAQILIY